MNQNLLFIAKAIGDLKVSINGEGCVGFSAQDVWTNFVTFELMGDQGNIFHIADGRDTMCALENLRIILTTIKIVPHSNDQSNSQFVTDSATAWLSTAAFETIKEGFAEHANVFRVVTQFKEHGRPIITLTVEVMLNKHVKAMMGLVERAELITEISEPMLIRNDEGLFLASDETEYPLEGPVLFKQFGVENLADAKYYYRININPNDTSSPTHILTKDKFDFNHPRSARVLTV